MLKVGLLDGQTIQAVIVAKQLKKAGYQVIMFCDTKLSYGYHTRYAFKKVLCPSTQKEPAKFHQFFLEYLKTEILDVIIPMNDYSAKYLSKYKDLLADKVSFSIPDLAIFMNGYDKNLLMKVCSAHNFPHPKSIDLSILKFGSIVENFSFPALIKPNETTGARGFLKVTSFDELWENYPKIFNEYGACHLQEFISSEGKQFKVQVLIHNNEVKNSTVLEKLRFYPVNGGSSCFNKSIVNNELVTVCSTVLKALKWEGFADFDLIEDPRDGIIKIMEINPRVPACIKASVVSGVDFPVAIVDISLKKKIKTYKYEPGKYVRYFSMDLLWLFSKKNGLKTFPQWIKRLFSSNHYLEDGELLDPVPFIIGTYAGLCKQLNPKFRAQKKEMNK